ncbi:MAG TPA: HRDC domain-containing protein [Miltoncostaeaceae bacterium]|nr:HRDC domain-containing protein [Miltoncostaeaceae bacterium]
MSTITPIGDAAGVAALAERARSAGRMALDFEFLWERTYAPLPCLAQVNIDGEIALVDPLAGAPLEPIADLVSDPQVTVVMHAPSADLTLLALACTVSPRALVDVQTVAGFVGLGAGQGLAALLERVLRVSLDKGERYTDWSRRPLSAGQSDYAAADVAHLLQLADELSGRVEGLGRAAWVAEEHERRFGAHAQFITPPDEAWRKVKGQGKLNPTQRAVLAAVAAWREREARRLDRPTAWLLPDRTLIELARRQPTTRRALQSERGMPERLGGQEADALLQAIATAQKGEPIHLPAGAPPELQQRADAIAPLASALLAARAEAADIAPTLVATRDEISRYLIATMRETPDGLLLASGWRHEIAGAALGDLVHGRLAVAAQPRRPYLIEISRDATAPG